MSSLKQRPVDSARARLANKLDDVKDQARVLHSMIDKIIGEVC